MNIKSLISKLLVLPKSARFVLVAGFSLASLNLHAGEVKAAALIYPPGFNVQFTLAYPPGFNAQLSLSYPPGF